MERFARSFYKTERDGSNGIKQLRQMPWFQFLKEDVLRGEVFPALRYGGAIHFYYHGARICEYKGNRAGAPTAQRSGAPFQPADRDAYRKIKEACDNWARKEGGADRERATLSRLCRKFSPYVRPAPGMVLLDTEIVFPRLFVDGRAVCDNVQVDLLFLDKSTGTLYFVEAKEAGDSRIKRNDEGQSPQALFDSLEVAAQLKKYNANLAERREEILSAYRDTLRIMGEIFDCAIYSGELALYDRTKLLIYGKSTDNGLKSLEAIRAELGDDVIVLADGLDQADGFPERIAGGSAGAQR